MKHLLPDEVRSAVDGRRMMAELTESARWVKLSGTAEKLEGLRTCALGSTRQGTVPIS
ncbi:MAG TPA: hypothetical protein VIL69_10825 [Roseomonas sp.]|jgi:hypothetical protein